MKKLLTKQLVLEDYFRLTAHKRVGLQRFFWRKHLMEPDCITEKHICMITSKCIMKEQTQFGAFLHFDKFGRVHTRATGEVSRTDKPDCVLVKWDEPFYIATIRGDKKTAIFYSQEEWRLE